MRIVCECVKRLIPCDAATSNQGVSRTSCLYWAGVFRITIEIHEKRQCLSMNHSRLQRYANYLLIVCKTYCRDRPTLAGLNIETTNAQEFLSGVLSEGLRVYCRRVWKSARLVALWLPTWYANCMLTVCSLYARFKKSLWEINSTATASFNYQQKLKTQYNVNKKWIVRTHSKKTQNNVIHKCMPNVC